SGTTVGIVAARVVTMPSSSGEALARRGSGADATLPVAGRDPTKLPPAPPASQAPPTITAIIMPAKAGPVVTRAVVTFENTIVSIIGIMRSSLANPRSTAQIGRASWRE